MTQPLQQHLRMTALFLACICPLYLAKPDENPDQFFTHDNQAAPPSLSVGTKLRFCTKTDILHCLIKETTRPVNAPVVNTKLLDGAAIVQMLNPGRTDIANRVDVIWDVYKPDSLQSTASTSDKRGKGVQRQVVPLDMKEYSLPQYSQKLEKLPVCGRK